MVEENKKNASQKETIEQEIDLIELAQKIWAERRLMLKVCGIAAIVAIVVAFSIPKEYATTVTLAPEVENTIAQGVSPDGTSLTLDPEFTRKLMDNLNSELERAISTSGNQPVLLCSSPIRLPFRRLIERTYPQIAVMSYNEISSNIKAKSIGVVRVAATRT